MFSGIIDHIGIIKEMTHTAAGLRLKITSEFEGLVLGESIAVDGCCLTVESFNEGRFQVSLSTETIEKTFATSYAPGTRVNLERALRFSDRVGGHLVSGHVDQTARVLRREEKSEFLHLVFHNILTENSGYLVKKGSVSVNGVSLTLNEVSTNGFEVMLIPHTLERTNLAHLRENDRVNLEFDWTSKVIVNEVRRYMENRE